MSQRIPPDLLRDMVREILLDVVDSEVAVRAGDVANPDTSRGRWRETVDIRTQDDLDRAVRRVLADATDPQRRGAIERGDVAFQLAVQAPASATPVDVEAVSRVDKGVVTERHVRAAAESGMVIVAARRVVVTPLAKDKARSLGVVIRRET